MDLRQFEEALHLRFKNPELLLQAVTHRSFVNEQQIVVTHNERLEFLGDAVVDFIAGEWLYDKFPDLREGQLTRMRAAIVRTETLAEFGKMIGIDRVLRLGYGEEASGGRSRSSVLGNAFEAVAGALYLDQGMEAVRSFLVPLFEPTLQSIMEAESTKDAKSRLQEWSQSQAERITPTYRVLQVEGPDHARNFTVEAWIGEQLVGQGTGNSIRRAEQNAAKDAISRMGIVIE
jgi:ribonuclease III